MGNVRVHVQDASTRSSIPGASVTIYNDDFGPLYGTTDTSGDYRFVATVGNYFGYRISKSGYEDAFCITTANNCHVAFDSSDMSLIINMVRSPTPTPTPGPTPTPEPSMPTPIPGGSPIPATNPFTHYFCSWLDANWHWYGIEKPGNVIEMSLPSGSVVTEGQHSYIPPTNPQSGIDRCGRSSPQPTPAPTSTPVPTTTPVPALSTVICNTSIKDEDGINKTWLYAGFQYALRTYLYKPRIGTGCSSVKDPLGGFDVEFLIDGVAIAKVQTTVSGYAAVYWTPQIMDAGSHNIKTRFRGDPNYGASESQVIGITVAVAHDRFTIRVINPAGGLNTVKVFDAIKIPGVDYYLTGTSMILIKSCTGTDCTVGFIEADGLTPGSYYYIEVSPPGNPVIVSGDRLVQFSSLKYIRMSPTPAGQIAQAICNLFGVTTDCTQWISAFTVDIATPAADAYIIKNHVSLYTLQPEEPGFWNYLGLSLSMLPFMGGTVKTIGATAPKFYEKGLELLEAARNYPDIAGAFEDMKMLSRIPSMTAADIDNLVALAKNDDILGVKSLLNKFQVTRYNYDVSIEWKANIARLLGDKKAEEALAKAFKMTPFAYKWQQKFAGYIMKDVPITEVEGLEFIKQAYDHPEDITPLIASMYMEEIAILSQKLEAESTPVLSEVLTQFSKVWEIMADKIDADRPLFEQTIKYLAEAGDTSIKEGNTGLFKETVGVLIKAAERIKQIVKGGGGCI